MDNRIKTFIFFPQINFPFYSLIHLAIEYIQLAWYEVKIYTREAYSLVVGGKRRGETNSAECTDSEFGSFT